MSFAGGGSDLLEIYREYGGAVVSTTINKYIYVNINKKFDNAIRVAYSENEDVADVTQIKHPIVREAMRHLDINGGLEITTIADIPSKGTGLGSSSTFTVGLLHALHAYKEQYISKSMLASQSCKIEIDLCGSRIGKQDQYAAAFGGLNFIEFHKNGAVDVHPIICATETVKKLQKNILVFYTGKTRSASEILAKQQTNLNDSKIDAVKKMMILAYQLASDLRSNDLSNFGEILDEGWSLKRSLSTSVSNAEIDNWYQLAKDSGAIGGKILGAGAGGFLLLYVKSNKQNSVRKALSMMREIDVKFESFGSQIVYYD
jgi:D-glycero-alpha-D-manno-heptose-7-phosphate kinase